MSVRKWNLPFMIDQKELGKKGEELACAELISKGYRILRRNYFFNHAEVDIICSDGDYIVFVEVKTRVSAYLSDPSLLIPMGKQRKIILAANEFAKTFYPEKQWRFD